MRILFISQLFDPEYSIKGMSLMRHWVEQGHDVEVLTTFPNYPTGKLFSGYSIGLRKNEYIDGVKVVRLWSHISHSKSRLSRAFTYLSFTVMALFAALLSKKADLVYTYHPQATTGLIGLAMRSLRGTPFVTDVQDLWPDALVATGMKKDGWLIYLIDRWCRSVYRAADQVVVLSEGFRDTLIKRGVDGSKVNVVYNWCPEEDKVAEIFTADKKLKHPPGAAHVMFAGNMGAAQSLRALIDAAASFPPNLLQLSLYGGGVERDELSRYVLEHGMKNVHINGYVSSSEILAVLNEADILAVHLRDDLLFRITIPSKTQTSMAMGKPILMAVGGEANDLIKKSGAGNTAEPGDVESIKRAMHEFIDKRSEWGGQGQKARDFYLRYFAAIVNYKKLDAVLAKVVSYEC